MFKIQAKNIHERGCFKYLFKFSFSINDVTILFCHFLLNSES